MNHVIFIVGIIGFLAAICAVNYYTGYRWTQLDHNPWAGKFLGGSFSGYTPGWNPGALDVEEIRKRGRRLMIAAPIVFVIALLIAIIIFARGSAGA
ncbi:MAG: hypothetical protein JWO16_1489 [Sphingomonas bacterium]|jgi:hypothetical protein|nr:hypothetical protein [Sphingomonas bacterium]